MKSTLRKPQTELPFAGNAATRPHASRRRPHQTPRAVRAVLTRLQGPGGLYNLGNAIALLAGIALQVSSAITTEPVSFTAILSTYLAGSPGASWLSVAMAIFFVSGEVYHRAWQGASPPDTRLNRLGDLLSAIAAIALTMSLIYFGDLLLALVSGTLLTGGKLGTAILPEIDDASANRKRVSKLFRHIVIVSRAPAMIALALELIHVLSAYDNGGTAQQVAGPAVMLVCYTLWVRADLMLVAREY